MAEDAETIAAQLICSLTEQQQTNHRDTQPKILPVLSLLNTTTHNELVAYAKIRSLSYESASCKNRAASKLSYIEAALSELQQKHPGTVEAMNKSAEQVRALKKFSRIRKLFKKMPLS